LVKPYKENENVFRIEIFHLLPITPDAFSTSLPISEKTSLKVSSLLFVYPEPEYESNILADRLAFEQVSNKICLLSL